MNLISIDLTRIPPEVADWLRKRVEAKPENATKITLVTGSGTHLELMKKIEEAKKAAQKK